MILIAAPTARSKNYCFPDYARQLRAMPYDTYLIDNSKDEDYIKVIWEAGIDADHTKPIGSPVQYIAQSQEIIRRKCVEQGYDLFFLESDVFCPINIVEYFDRFDLPVLSATYFCGEGDDTTMNIQTIETDFMFRKSRLMSMKETYGILDGTIHQVFACGFGCCLIRNHVLQRIEFRSSARRGIDSATMSTFSDTFFYADLKDLDIPAFVDTGVIVDHRRQDWNANIDLMTK